MGAFEQLRRLGTIADEPITDLTPIDIAWIEQRVATTLAENDVACSIDRGFLRVADAQSAEPGHLSLAPLGEALLQLDRGHWGAFVWEWCANHVNGVESRLELEPHVREIVADVAAPQPAYVGVGTPTPPTQVPAAQIPAAQISAPQAQPTSLASVLATLATPGALGRVEVTPGAPELPPVPAVPADAPVVDLAQMSVGSTQTVPTQTVPTQTVPTQTVPTQTVPLRTPDDHPAPTAPLGAQHQDAPAGDGRAHGLTLAEAIAGLTLRMVTTDTARSVPEDALVPTAIPGMSAALCVDGVLTGHAARTGAPAWVDSDDLDVWGITREMALSMAETHLSDQTPEVTIVFLDERTPVHVIETKAPIAPALLPYIDQHVAIRVVDSPRVLVAVANDHLLFVHVGDEESSAASLRPLVDGAVAEYEAHPGMVTPGVFAWTEGGQLEAVATSLHSAAGRLAARARTTNHLLAASSA